MDKRIIITLVVFAVMIATIVGYYLYKTKSNSSTSQDADIPNNNTSLTLSLGSEGQEVRRLQQYLNTQLAMQIWKSRPTYNGKEIVKLLEDGIFGQRTLAVVRWHFGTDTVTTNQF